MIPNHHTSLALQPIIVPDQAVSAWENPGLEATLQLVQRNAGILLAQQAIPTKTRDNSGQRKDKVDLEILGVPNQVKRVDSQGLWRHYTRNLESILQQRLLRSTRQPYVYSEHDRYREVYPSLYGIFITTTEPPKPRIGVFEESPFVDFELPPQTALLFISPGIFLIPAQDSIIELPIHIVGAGRYTRHPEK